MSVVTWFFANWGVILTDASVLLGGLAALDTALCVVFPHAGILGKIQVWIKDAQGFITKV